MFRFGKSEEEFQEFYRDHYRRIQRTIIGITRSQMVSEELTQDAFLKAWKGLPFFGMKSTLSTWIFQIAINVALDWIRTHKMTKWVPLLETSVDLSPQGKAIEEALDELLEDDRLILVLHYYEGFKAKELKKILVIPEGTVKSRLFSAKKKLRKILLAKGFDV